MTPKRTALGILLQERREARGYSRTRLGELAGIKPATLEAWELGRVGKPPIQDVLKLARFLSIPLEEIEAAALEEAAPPPSRRPPSLDVEAVPLLAQAIELFDWTDEQAAAALDAVPAQVRAWRGGEETMPLPAVMTVAALLGLHAAAALGDTAAVADVAAALGRGQRRY